MFTVSCFENIVEVLPCESEPNVSQGNLLVRLRMLIEERAATMLE